MAATDTALSADWLGVCRRAAAGVGRVLEAAPSTEQRARYTGARGEGGDRTLEIDSGAESAVLEQLEGLHEGGFRFQALSEERGAIDFGGDQVRVIIDPIDGSLNAKRDACHYALSVAVADGETMGDVAFAFVHDFGSREQWWAVRGEGAFLDGRRLDPAAPERRTADGRLELLGIESADPRLMRDAVDALAAGTHRLRALGTIASTLCQVAAARFDAMLTLARCRGVDAAAGQLIVREAGGMVAFPGCEQPLAAPLDAVSRSRLVAARSERTLADLIRIAP
ncbi:MAG: inositol monophosphatase family protein [Solirubrobacteraceae bacterium]